MGCPWDPRGEGSSFPDRTFVDQKTRVHFFRRAQPKVRSYYEERVITEHLVPIPTLRPNNSPPSPRQIRRFDVIEQVCLAAPLNRSSWINSPGEGTRPASSSPASAATILSALAKGGLSRTHWSIPTWRLSHRRGSSCGRPQKRNASFRRSRLLGWRPVLGRTWVLNLGRPRLRSSTV